MADSRRGRGRQDRPYRDWHGGHRRALREPLYLVEEAGAADLIVGGRLQLGISRGSPEQMIGGWSYFGYRQAQGRVTPT